MQRWVTIFLFLLAVSLPALAEEIALKDGTKIVGHMTGITSDTIEVETSYGKIQLKRSEILTITFSENNPANAPVAKVDLPKIDESLTGTQYLNRTAKFALTLPPEWIIDANLRHLPTTFAGLSSHDKTRFVIVILEEYPGSLESYKEMTMLNARRSLSNFEQLAESRVTIDGKAGLLVFYRGLSQKGGNLPVEFLSALIPSGNTYTRVTAWCVEPLFHDMQPSFEKIVNSYHSTGPLAAAKDPARP